ncbi:ABC transporter permease [Flaviflexus huanghaiensis]|uniref:ABC transporter permease n=1 Tax=Flaviflexus huanghaiensis TaxID=1111473 RepID=UPI0015FE6891|nr:ABC transporter permease [Flaviflexus huanghaiensis]
MRTNVSLGLLGAILVLALWWVTSTNSTELYYPAAPDVLQSVWEYWFMGEGRPDLLSSLANLAVGLLAGIVGGFALGLLIGQVPFVRYGLTPTLEFVRAIPATALIPFAIVIFGLGDQMKVTIIALGTLFPVLLNVIDGVRSIPRESHDTAKSFGIVGWTKQAFVVIPAVLPRAVAGITVAIPLSLILVVTSEMRGSREGIGAYLVTASNSFDQSAVWGVIVLLGVLGFALTTAFTFIEQRLLAWDRGLHGRDTL